ncbi:AAA family ATPase, partial [Photobacterium halotolerans]|uniref:AAA family ATPase n=1 Tax=Photobacterium halotolerans TaxID=265726 RepID=UPI000488E5D5
NEAFTVIDEPSEADILEAQALALAEEYDAEQRNDEPPSDSALIAKVRAPADDFDARSFEDWMNADLRTPEEMTLWGDAAIIRGGISLLGGAPKVGKSTLLLQLLMAAACGGEFLGHHFNTPSVVLWIQGELKPEFFRSRMLEARAAFTPAEQELIKKNLIITRNCSLELNGVNAFAYSALIQKFKPDLVAIDPIRNLVVLKNENDASEMKKALLSLQKTAIDVDPDTSVLCVHHTRKDAAVIEGKSNTVPHDLYAGSGALRGIYDFGMIMLNDAQHNQTKSIHFESRNGPNMDSLTLRREGHEFLVGGMMEHAAQEFIGENKEGAVVGIVTQVLIEHKYFTERTAGEWQAVRDMAKNRLESLGLHSLADKTIKKYCEDSGVVHFFKSNGNKFYAYYRTTMLD